MTSGRVLTFDVGPPRAARERKDAQHNSVTQSAMTPITSRPSDAGAGKSCADHRGNRDGPAETEAFTGGPAACNGCSRRSPATISSPMLPPLQLLPPAHLDLAMWQHQRKRLKTVR